MMPLPRPARRRSLVLPLTLLLGGCALTSTDGEVGVATMQIQNDSNQELTVEYSRGNLGLLQVLATAVPAALTAPILRSSGCFGCIDPPPAW